MPCEAKSLPTTYTPRIGRLRSDVAPERGKPAHRVANCAQEVRQGRAETAQPGFAGRAVPAASGGWGPPRFRSKASYSTLVTMLQSVHHIGIRVSDEQRALAFYRRFGFEVVYRDQHDPVSILRNATGVELNLVVNASQPFDGKNRLMDVPEKFPGYTHVAFKVASLQAAVEDLKRWGVAISEGPKQLGRGLSLFIRDPDANVIELRQDLT